MPRQVLTRRPPSSHVSTWRIYDDSGRISRQLHQRARRTTLRPMRMDRRAAIGVMPVNPSATLWFGGPTPHSSLGPVRTLPPQQCSYMTSPSRTTLVDEQSTRTSRHYWRPPPFSKRSAPYRDTDPRPCSPFREQGCSRRGTTPCHRHNHRLRHKKPQTHLVLT